MKRLLVGALLALGSLVTLSCESDAPPPRERGFGGSGVDEQTRRDYEMGKGINTELDKSLPAVGGRDDEDREDSGEDESGQTPRRPPRNP